MNEFQRDISIGITRHENNLVASSTLKDRFHHIQLMVVVDFDTLVINSITLQFHKSPTPACQSMQAKLNALTGTIVGKGLTRKIFETTGGPQGCSNIRNMLLTCLPLVLNVKAGSGIADQQQLLNNIEKELAGTCVGYRHPKDNA